MGSSIDGLVTGMNTSDIISQLMQLEAAPQTALKNKVTVQNKVVSAYQGINTRMASLLSAAQALTKTETWGAMKATSSSDAAAVTTAPGASAGSLSFKVDRLAAAHTTTFTGSVGSVSDATGAPVMSGATFKVLRTDGTEVDVTPTDASLQAVVKKINETADAAYRAAAVQVAPGQYTLQLTAKSTGDTAKFAHAPAGIDLLGTANVTTLGVNAQLTVGTTADAYQVTSATNTFNDLLPGVNVTAVRAQAVGDARVTIDIAADKEGMAAKVQALVDSANTVLNDIASQTRGRNGAVPASPLSGDTAVRKLAQDVLSAVASGAGDLGSLSAVGVALDKTGQLTFDKQKFLNSYAADSAKTQSYFDGHADVAGGTAGTFQAGWDTANGIARKLEVIGLVATEGVILPNASSNSTREGLLPGLIKRKNEFIGNLNDQVAAWDLRLETRRTALSRQYSALEVALGKLQSQSTWLAGQLAGLPSGS